MLLPRAVALLLAIAFNACAQPSQPISQGEPVLGEAELETQPQEPVPGEVELESQPGLPALPSQSPPVLTETGEAMAESAKVAMAEATGAPTSPPDAVTYVGAIPNPEVVETQASPVAFMPVTTPPPSVQQCKVLSGGTAQAMQVLLFFCSCAALAVKYRRESGDRTLTEFLMDSSKQLIGAGWIHVMNLSFAKGLEAHFQAGDECTWYWLNIVLDCTLGVAVEYVILLFLTTCIKKNAPAHAGDFETGDYKSGDGAVDPVKYVKQVGLWLLVVSLMKACMAMIMTLGHDPLTNVAQAVLQPVASSATAKLFVVMILSPVFFNVFQFWMVDNFIKKKSGGGSNDTMEDMETDGSMQTRLQHGDL